MVKNIAIMDSVYRELVKRKRPNESFSEEIGRLMGKRSIMDLAGSLKISDEEAEKIKSNIKRMREESDLNIARRAELSK